MRAGTVQRVVDQRYIVGARHVGWLWRKPFRRLVRTVRQQKSVHAAPNMPTPRTERRPEGKKASAGRLSRAEECCFSLEFFSFSFCTAALSRSTAAVVLFAHSFPSTTASGSPPHSSHSLGHRRGYQSKTRNRSPTHGRTTPISVCPPAAQRSSPVSKRTRGEETASRTGDVIANEARNGASKWSSTLRQRRAESSNGMREKDVYEQQMYVNRSTGSLGRSYFSNIWFAASCPETKY